MVISSSAKWSAPGLTNQDRKAKIQWGSIAPVRSQGMQAVTRGAAHGLSGVVRTKGKNRLRVDVDTGSSRWRFPRHS